MSSSWTSPPDSSGAYAFAIRFLRNAVVLPGFLCLILAISACDSETRSTATVAPPGSEQRAVEAGQTGRALGPDGLPVLDPPKGVNVNVDSLFTEDIKDPIERIKRLENAVLEMRRDYEATLPAIKRLVAVEKDMQTLTAQLEMLTNGDAPPVSAAPSAPVAATPLAPSAEVTATPHQNDPAPSVPAVPQARSTAIPPQETPVAVSALSEDETVAPVESPETPAPKPETVTALAPPEPVQPSAKAPPPPVPKVATSPPESAANAPPAQLAPPPTKPAATAPPPEVLKAPPAPVVSAPPQSNAVAVSGLRLGEDGGKTRLVIDLNRSASHKTDIDNDEKILVIEISDAAWNAPASKTFKSPVIQSYTTQPLENGKGTRLIVTLKKAAKIALDSLLPPEANNKNYRLVIDLK